MDAHNPTSADETLIPQVLLEAPLVRGQRAQPVQRQLHQRLQDAILCGRLAPGSRLPGSRALAQALAISRNTVTAAYDLLAAEGFLQSDRQGTCVARHLQRPRSAAAPVRQAPPRLAGRVEHVPVSMGPGGANATLRPGVPALSHFPLADWRRALDRAVSRAGVAALGYGDPLGEPELRGAIARHLSVARGVRCTGEQVVITEGAQEGLVLCARLFANPGDTVWMEDPGYRGAKAAFWAGDLNVVPMRVDANGLCTTDADWKAQRPRLVYTTPSHQYPTGAVLSAVRRLELIAHARRHGAWIIEDDYDSEFRHAGDSIGAMQGLEVDPPVIYVGTFSKTLFPGLRLGFVVLPPSARERLEVPLRELLRGGHRHEQLALCDFMESGEFVRHLGRMRRLYRARHAVLCAALAQHLRVPHQVEGGEGGLHVVVRLPPAYPDQVIAEAARAYGIAPAALSSFSASAKVQDNGLVLGYGNTATERLEPLVKRLGQLVRKFGKG